MDPAVAVLAALALVVLVLGMAWGLVVYGASTRDFEVSALEGRLKWVTAERDEIKAREAVRARGAQKDFADEAAVARGAAGLDRDGVLRPLAELGGAAAGEQGPPADAR